jgi:hypothetical protein
MSANSLRSGYSPAARLGEWTHRRRIVNAGQPVDLDELDRWVSTGCVCRRGATLPYGPTLLEARDAGISSIAVSALGVVLRTAEDAPTGRAYWGRSLECR